MGVPAIFETLCDAVCGLGADRARVIRAEAVQTDASFRTICASNACGMYGRCHMCPPDIGDIEELMAKIYTFDYALVYQTVTALEDSYDFEGMMEAKKHFVDIISPLQQMFTERGLTNTLFLGAGGCGVCEVCAKQTGEPCRFPERAIPSLEGYGVNVSQLAPTAGMKYVNGQDTVTYFGAVFFTLNGRECNG